MPKTVVIDIYHNDPVTNFQKVKDAGIVGVIHKATEGLTYKDPKYAIRRRAFVDVGMAWGAYHFYHGGGVHEADFFLSIAQPDEHTLVALDWETTPSGFTPSAAAARAFLERIEEKLGRKAVVYSGNVAKEKIRGNDPYFGAHRLWLAQYGTTWKVQASWKRPWLWQYSESGSVSGIKGKCDVDAAVATMDANDILATWDK